jgi:Pyruvate/2-oxoacid:ferredoxin oxidoreductase delta subunit
MHPLRREILDEDFNNMNYLLEKFKNDCIVKFSEETQGQLIGGMLNRAEKSVGYPKMPNAPPVPEFNRADLTTPQTNLPMKDEQKLTNKPNETFDKANEVWICCPRCGSKKITHEGKKGTYTACFGCGIFLNVGKNGEPLEPTEMKK